MVKIRKGNHETTVTMGSYKNVFKPLGYTLVNEKKAEKPVEEAEKSVEEVEKPVENFKNKNKKPEEK